MSESLLFAILGFLIACLLGTVFASFLWRRAVTVTTRKITEDENFAGLDEVADLKADLRAAQNSASSKDREIEAAATKAAELETAIAEAKAAGEGTAENLKQELQNASTALEAAHAERDAAKAALAAKDDEISAAEGRVEAAQERVGELENAIRALVKETSLFETNAPQKAPEETPRETKTPDATVPTSTPAPAATDSSKDDEATATTPVSTPSVRTPKAEPTKPLTATTSDSGDKEAREPAAAISKSLEERIEALKQGESTSA